MSSYCALTPPPARLTQLSTRSAPGWTRRGRFKSGDRGGRSQTGIRARTRGHGLAVADFGAAGLALVVLQVRDRGPSAANNGRYRVGSGLDGQGRVSGGWSAWQDVPDWASFRDQGAALTVADLDGDGVPELVVFHIDDFHTDHQNPGLPNKGLYRVGHKLAIDGTVDGWGEWRFVDWESFFNQGAGIAVADLSNNGRLDLIIFQIDNPPRGRTTGSTAWAGISTYEVTSAVVGVRGSPSTAGIRGKTRAAVSGWRSSGLISGQRQWCYMLTIHRGSTADVSTSWTLCSISIRQRLRVCGGYCRTSRKCCRCMQHCCTRVMSCSLPDQGITCSVGRRPTSAAKHVRFTQASSGTSNLTASPNRRLCDTPTPRWLTISAVAIASCPTADYWRRVAARPTTRSLSMATCSRPVTVSLV